VNPDWIFRWQDAEGDFDPEELEAMAEDFTLEIYEASLVSDPEDPEILAELGEIYTKSGRIEDGLDIDRRLVKLLPDNPVVYYNLACSLALLGRKKEAVKALETALRRGFTDFDLMRTDEDLASLRNEPSFQALMAMAKKARLA